MIITIIEASVPSNRWSDLEIAYKEKIKHIPPQLRETFLIHDKKDKQVWRIISIWHSMSDYEEAVKSMLDDSCMQIFHEVNAQPTRRIFDVPAHHVRV
ncbi:MAG: hypothetical protein LWX83_12400 [Anaerolineae bacterium]|nr:hypothetical protein [Anaerolineae bacterium]